MRRPFYARKAAYSSIWLTLSVSLSSSHHSAVTSRTEKKCAKKGRRFFRHLRVFHHHVIHVKWWHTVLIMAKAVATVETWTMLFLWDFVFQHILSTGAAAADSSGGGRLTDKNHISNHRLKLTGGGCGCDKAGINWLVQSYFRPILAGISSQVFQINGRLIRKFF